MNNTLFYVFCYIAFGFFSYWLSESYDKLKRKLFESEGYFGKYLTLHYGWYSSYAEIKNKLYPRYYPEAKKRLAVYNLLFVPLGWPVGMFMLVTFPVYIIISMILDR